jgi:hypothetical protein
MKIDNYPDILNSKNERVILELPDYAYCHSTQTSGNENHSVFIGRQSMVKKLTNLISSNSKTGVYLVTGNRGVGKSRLVEEVIKETSIQKQGIQKSISFLVIALFLTLGLQYATNQHCNIPCSLLWAMVIIALILFFFFGHISYLRKTTRQYEKSKNWLIREWTRIWHNVEATFKDFFMLPNKANPFLRTQNVLKLALLLFLIQIFAAKICFTHFQLFIIYLCAVSGYYYIKYAKLILIQKCRKSYNEKSKYWEYKNKNVSLANAFKKRLQLVTFFVVVVSIATAVFSMKCHWWLLFIGIAMMLVTVFIMHWYVIILTLIKDNKELIKCRKWKALKFTWEYSYPQLTSILNRINNYIKNSSRIYLKINFGHDVLNERDVLRLITRTLTTEYKKFRHSWIHTLYWRALALAVLLFATHLFYKNIYKNDILQLVEKCNLYQHSSQLFYASNSIAKRSITLAKYKDLENILNTKKDSKERKKLMADMDTLKGIFFDQYSNINYTHLNEYKVLEITTKIDSLKGVFITLLINERHDSTILVSIDKIINRTWFYILNVPNYFWKKGGSEINYNHAPVNYAWLFIFFSFYLLGCLLLRLKFFKIPPYTIKRQLKQLNENITYSIEREFNVNGGNEKGSIKAGIGISKKKTRLIADAHEIEKELQDILENIQKIPALMARPEFVIVFDELDKVSPETPNQGSETKHKEALFASNSTRERQAIILKLLSNMKYFLSTAKAKFIFIAGREMYDMYLADIADRNNYFGSIFNEVIFVPSFLTDVKYNKKQYNITTLVEEYVCRHLIPQDYPNIEYNLKEYSKYLDDEIYFNLTKELEILRKRKKIHYIRIYYFFFKKHIVSSIKEKKKCRQQVAMKKQKIIATLQQFIIYLAHTSKGAPKKMVQVFESFIKNIDNEELKNQNLVVKQFKNTKLYLNFDYYDQFTIGMSAYLITPVINRLSDANIQEHSDKLMVSTLHFVDYMMKFHSQNFSWRSIDISPEVIEINRSPELKTIVNDIVTLFEQIHFYKPVITLYEFKFDALLAQEIFFLSKMEERFSAQFNFSLDESLLLKEYYKGLLRERQAEYEKHKTYGSNYVSSIASLHIVIGDLHFLDDELEEAALHYKDGLYLLQMQLEADKEKENLEIFYLFIRNQLKLAYLYEKRKQVDFAYLLYGELTTRVARYRDFDLEKIGISIRKNGEDFIMVQQHTIRKNKEKDPYKEYIETPKLDIYDIPIYDYYDKAKIRPMQFKQLSPATQQVMFKNMTFEGLQLLYLPLLAKLQILEKRSLVGILEKDIKAIEQDFDFLTRTISHSESKILAADFYSKMGDILYYKNQVFNRSSDMERSSDKKRRINISHYACLYYKKAFIALTVRMSNENEKKEFEDKTILEVLYTYKKADYIASKVNTRYRAMMARVLSNLGDAYLQATEEQCDACPFKKAIPIKSSRCGGNNDNFWKNWWNFLYAENDEKLKLSDFIKRIKENYTDARDAPLHNVELALFLYSLSMKYYRKANHNKQYAYQIEKILNVLKYCLRHKIHNDKIKFFLNEKKHKTLPFRSACRQRDTRTLSRIRQPECV